VPLIVLTSLTGAGQDERARRAGFARYLVKFNAKQLVAAVEEFCNRETAVGRLEESA
jgi:CheY-like chemotaxis protein